MQIMAESQRHMTGVLQEDSMTVRKNFSSCRTSLHHFLGSTLQKKKKKKDKGDFFFKVQPTQKSAQGFCFFFFLLLCLIGTLSHSVPE